MTRLRLAAGDAEDLQILSARLQDAVLKLKDVSWQPKKRRFAAVVNRLTWEEGGKTRVRMERVLVGYHAGVDASGWSSLEGERRRLTLHLRLPHRHARELLAELVEIPQVVGIRDSQ